MTPAAAVAQTLRFETQCRALDFAGVRDHVASVLAVAGIRYRRDVTIDGELVDIFAIGAAAAIVIVIDRPASAVVAHVERLAKLSRVAEVIVVAVVGKLGYMPTGVAGKPLHVVHLSARPR
jgi:hypothetical protein